METSKTQAEVLEQLKKEKLEHYAERDLVRFCQLDGWADVQEDSLMRRDKDGDTCFAGQTEELMTGYYNVRILITRGTTVADALRLIGKLVDWLREDPDLLIRNGEHLDHAHKGLAQPSVMVPDGIYERLT